MKLDLTEWNITDIENDDSMNSIKIIAENDTLEILLPKSAYEAFKTLK